MERQPKRVEKQLLGGPTKKRLAKVGRPLSRNF
jgi:hypothetical protein